ncbi:MAG: DUF4199 domain-containing protein [Bacteroidales bacterium]
MPSQKSAMAGPAFQFGLLIAAGLIILSLIMYVAGMITANWISYVGYAILLGGLIFGTLRFRDEYSGGFISYGRALGFGTLVSFFAALISAVFSYLFYTVLAPDALNELRIAAEINILETTPNITDQQLDLAIKMVNPLMMALTYLFSYTFVGFVFSLVTAAFLKRKDPMEY